MGFWTQYTYNVKLQRIGIAFEAAAFLSINQFNAGTKLRDFTGLGRNSWELCGGGWGGKKFTPHFNPFLNLRKIASGLNESENDPANSALARQNL